MLAPICLFVYNRPNHLKETFKALQANYLANDSDLYVFSDGAKSPEDQINVSQVREIIRTFNGFKNINAFEAPNNNGLANSIIQGVTKILEQYNKVIVLEDDLVTLPNFLSFMNQALDFYESEPNVQSINGFSLMTIGSPFDGYFQTRTGSWGWGTWKNRWNIELFNKATLRDIIVSNPGIVRQFGERCGHDMPKMLTKSVNNQNDSWYVRWTFDHFRNNTFSLFPKYTLVKNIGYGSGATHTKGINSFSTLEMDPRQTSFSFAPYQYPDKDLTNRFLYNFSIKRKLLLRLSLLKSKNGRHQIIQEIKSKFLAVSQKSD
jgi:hypothetical protein